MGTMAQIVHSRMIPIGPLLPPCVDQRSRGYLEAGIITACAFGYIMLGVVAYFCINRGRLAGLPNWYTNTDRMAKDKLLLGLWYFGVFFLWPLVLPLWFMNKIGSGCCRRLGTCCRQRTDGHRDQRGRTIQRDAVDLVRWHDIPLNDQENHDERPERGGTEEIVWWQTPSVAPELIRPISPKTVEEGGGRAVRERALSTIAENPSWEEQLTAAGRS